jgi:hypothetical protein
MKFTPEFSANLSAMAVYNRFRLFFVVCIAIALVGALTMPAFSQEPAVTYTTLTAPDAGTKAGQGTFAIAINDPGTIAGFYVNQGSYNNQTAVFHGFVFSTTGQYTEFDAPKAGTKPGQGTEPAAINVQGKVVGIVYDSAGVEHCFIRNPGGSFTIVNAPGAGTGKGQGTGCTAINKSGEIAGTYIDAANTSHGFIRTSSGSLTSFDVAGAGTGPDNGTIPARINDSGTVAGYFVNDNGNHGFFRDVSGTITTFDAPGSGGPTGGTSVTAINASGTIAGQFNNDGGPTHGFVRATNGTFMVFKVGVVDFATGINNAGIVVGFTGTTTGYLAFLRASSGSITKFVPTGCAAHSVVEASGINTAGDIVGFCGTSTGTYVGFLRTP